MPETSPDAIRASIVIRAALMISPPPHAPSAPCDGQRQVPDRVAERGQGYLGACSQFRRRLTLQIFGTIKTACACITDPTILCTWRHGGRWQLELTLQMFAPRSVRLIGPEIAAD